MGMNDPEFLSRLQVAMNNLIPGVRHLCDVDYSNLNLVNIELTRRMTEAGIAMNTQVMHYAPVVQQATPLIVRDDIPPNFEESAEADCPVCNLNPKAPGLGLCQTCHDLQGKNPMDSEIKCHKCETPHNTGTASECRNYGEGKQPICWTCAQKPENHDMVQRAMAAEGLCMDLDPKYLVALPGGGFRAPTEQELAEIKKQVAGGANEQQ